MTTKLTWLSPGLLAATTALLVATALATASCSDDATEATDTGADGDVGDASTDLGPAVYDGAWEAAFEATDVGAYLSVWGTGPDFVVTVGGQPGEGRAFADDGAGWEELPIPDGGMLFWVYGVDDELWMVGEGGRALLRSAEGDYIETETGVDVDLWGVWGIAADDVWTVGGDPRDRDGEPVLLHWGGEAWEAKTLPALDRDAPALFKVWGTSATNVYAVGSRGLLLRYDGAAWAQVLAGASEDLISLWGTGPDDIVVAGGRTNGTLSRWDGQGWTTETLVGVPGLNGVWVDDQGTAHMVGVRGTSIRVAPGSFEPEREVTSTTLTLHGVWGRHGGPRFAVGGSLDANPPYTGIALVDP